MMFKKLIVCFSLVLLTFVFIFPIKVFAEESIFLDLSVEDEYYEDIMYFFDKGVIKGRADGLFHSKDFITVAEAITVIEKVFGNEDNLPKDWTWWENPSHQDNSGWMPDWYFPIVIIKGDYLKSASRNTLSCILLNTVDQPVVNNTAPWGIESALRFEEHIYYLNMMARGYWSKEDPLQAYVGVTRGEFCSILREFETNKDLPKIKEIFIDINERYWGEIKESDKIVRYYNVYYAIMRLPEKVQKLYVKNNGKFYLTDDEFWQRNFENLDNASGAYFYQPHNNKIYVRDVTDKTIFHEFGHFLDYNFPKYLSRVKEIYDKDLNEYKLMSIVKGEYCKTSVREYFAEGFAMYMLQPESLKKYLPELYEIYGDLIQEVNLLEI